ncbi:MAG TPA: dienelactone hydrolase family protein [Usitatibacter sp.]|nr:dienelactone hydrolase family protein [Usitatibacter sp.]
MERKKASDFPPEVLQLFDGFVHGRITRRDFLDRAAKYAMGGFTAAAMLEALTPNFAWAQQVKPDDPRIKAGYAHYESPKGSGRMRGYLAEPTPGTHPGDAPRGRTPKLAAIVVIHENRGLNPYIEDVARRLATAGYVAFAPDGLTPAGGYPGDEDKAREIFPKLDPAKMREDLCAAVDYLKLRPDFNGKVAAIGFCYGGGIANLIATRFPDLAGAVPYYGIQPPADQAAKIRCPMLLHYASEDSRINAGWPAFEKVLDEHHVKHQAYIYPNTQHGFHNDTTPRYDEAAAKLSWQRTLEFFHQNLKA